MTTQKPELPENLTSVISQIPGRKNAKAVDPSLFRNCLLDNLRDGVIFVDSQSRIMVWSQTVEVMTGMSANKVDGMELTPSMLRLSDSLGNEIPNSKSPIDQCFEQRRKISGDYILIGRSGREAKIEMTFIPVIGSHDSLHGAIILAHDSTVQLDLQRQLKDLYKFSMLDPLTQVANRAQFERALDEFVRLRNTSDFECSLIVCDIDFFKAVNDNYNHHIGDQALVAFAGLLKQFVRQQDLVARYGGEEFVILCANCDAAAAVQRAEEIRITLTKTPQQMLDGKCITASFGVAELLPGDAGTDFFVRADTALLRAKELGRNQVVESSASMSGQEPILKSSQHATLNHANWRKLKGQILESKEYKVSTPMPVLVEKLRGYIIESEAEIRRVEPDFASLVVEIEDENNYSRKGSFIVNIEFQECETQDNKIGRRTDSYIRISVREGKRKWFSSNSNDLAPIIIKEIQNYLMLNNDAAQLKPVVHTTSSNR
ncbi:MAG: diguanylate cyclase [Mariniblastus sp.]|nr:diguanylate cyclase [Mariniblastus sp.]